MIRSMRIRSLLLGAAVATIVAVAACSQVGTIVSTIGGQVYNTAAVALKQYCSMSLAQREVAQLVVAGKIYNSGICDVVNGDTTLEVQLAAAAQTAAAQLLDNAVSKAVTDGKLTQAQADIILAVTTPAIIVTSPAATTSTTAATPAATSTTPATPAATTVTTPAVTTTVTVPSNG